MTQRATTNRSGTLAAMLLLGACAGGASSSTSSPPPTSPAPTTTTTATAEPSPSTATPAPAGPCVTDADCRLRDLPACGCDAVLASVPVTPSPTPCFAPPCLNREAYCNPQHLCAVRPQTAPAPSEPMVPES